MFKIKEIKQLKNNDNYLLELRHNEELDNIEKEKRNLENYKNEINTINNNINNLNNKINKTKNDYNLLYEYVEKINLIKKKINDIENDTSLINYYLNAGHLIHDYYNNDNSYTYDFFNKHKKSQDSQKKFNIHEKYLNKMDDKFINKEIVIDYNKCNNCKSTNIRISNTESIMICVDCGVTKNILVDSDKPTYREPPKELTYFAYKRINHFNEWLAQFQAKESTDIPKQIYEDILYELKKERFTDLNSLKSSKVRIILKKLKYNKYYEHIPHIINRLNGNQPPIISKEIEEQLRCMFKQIQVPFLKNCPKDRKNFLSYSYVLHKFIELLELDEYLPCFPLLKSREKLNQQDQIWRHICDHCKWEFIKSI